MKFTYTLLLSTLMLFSTGCQFFQSSNTGKGTTFQYGKMEGYIESSLAKVHSATALAVKDLELLTVSAIKDGLTSIYVVKNAKSETIKINIQKLSSNSVKVDIKVGNFTGDQMYSQAIFDAIKKRL